MSEQIGIIYPPPELRNIVDKTAGFVAASKNGPEFEDRIRQNEQNNPKFNFPVGFFRTTRNDDIVVRTANCRGGFHEDDGLFGQWQV